MVCLVSITIGRISNSVNCITPANAYPLPFPNVEDWTAGVDKIKFTHGVLLVVTPISGHGAAAIAA